jgi:streptogramin lyase
VGYSDETVPADRPPAGEGTPLRIGEILGGYVIERVVGRGGMGVVYRAQDPHLRRSVALKVIAAEGVVDDMFRRRFEREWRIAASLEHPNIVPVYGAGTAAGRMYLAMRYIDGITLEALLHSGALPPIEAASIIDQVASALDAAHAAGLVHRDVKPGNILLTGADHQRRAYLSDFGIALPRYDVTRLTVTGQFLGTPAYAAPEQIRAAPLDARTDVYALGGTLHHCLAGSPPYPAPDSAEVLQAHLHDPPPRPSTLAPHVPRTFDGIVARAMAKDPARRYSSAGDVGRRALAAASGKPLPRATTSVATGAAAPRTHRRRSRLAAAGSLAVLAMVVSAAIALRPTDGSRDRRSSPVLGFKLDSPPDAVAAGGRFVWALSNVGGALTRVDTISGHTASFPEPFDLGGGLFADLALGSGAVWVAHATAGGGVDRVDPGTGEGLAHIAFSYAAVVGTGPGGVWALSAPPSDAGPHRRGQLVAIDPRTNRSTGPPLTVGREPSALAVTRTAVWVADKRSGTVLRVDPDRHTIRARVPVGRRPLAVAADDRVVWVLNGGDRSLTRIDPRSDETVGAPVSLGKELQDIALTRTALWVAAADSTLTKLDPVTGQRQADSQPVGEPPLALSAADRLGVWIASAHDQTLQRLR